jgi:branched-chain amino acid transport system substrate-binding protein
LSGEAVALFKRFTDKYKDIKDANEVPFPSYIGNAYDAAHMIALAIKKGGSTEGPKMHAAFESLGSYDGLVKNYITIRSPPAGARPSTLTTTR